MTREAGHDAPDAVRAEVDPRLAGGAGEQARGGHQEVVDVVPDDHDVAWYMLEPSRSTETIRGVLGEFEGVVVCDAYSGYEAWPLAARASCGSPTASRTRGASSTS